jgi:hypothetical protein
MKDRLKKNEEKKGDSKRRIRDCVKVEERKIARLSMKRKELPKSIKKEASSKTEDSDGDNCLVNNNHEEAKGDSKRRFNDCGKAEQQNKTRLRLRLKIPKIIRNKTLSAGAKVERRSDGISRSPY